MEMMPHKYMRPIPVVVKKAPITLTNPRQAIFSNIDMNMCAIIIYDYLKE